MTRRALLALLAAARSRPFGYSLKGFPGWPLERCFAFCAELGFTGVELFAPAGVTAPEARRLSRKYRLPIVSILEDLRLAGDEAAYRRQLESSLRLAAATGRPIVETVVGGKPEEWPAIRPQFISRLRPWARLAEKYRVVLAIKAHIGSALHLPGDAAGLCRETGSPYLRINYDYSHFQLQRLPLAESLDAAFPYIAMIHIKDFTGTPEKYRFALPGEGRIDYAAYAALLGQRGFAGPIVTEVSTHVLQRPGFEAESAARFVAAQVMPKFTR